MFSKALVVCFDSLSKLFCPTIDVGDRRKSFYFGKWVRWKWDFMKLFFNFFLWWIYWCSSS